MWCHPQRDEGPPPNAGARKATTPRCSMECPGPHAGPHASTTCKHARMHSCIRTAWLSTSQAGEEGVCVAIMASHADELLRVALGGWALFAPQPLAVQPHAGNALQASVHACMRSEGRRHAWPRASGTGHDTSACMEGSINAACLASQGCHRPLM